MSKSVRIKPFKFTTMQNLFDTVYFAVMKQGAQCISKAPGVDEVGGCSLRNRYGHACAFGHVLTDEQAVRGGPGYLNDVTGSVPVDLGISEATALLPELGIEVNSRAHGLLKALQQTHDGIRSVEHFTEFFHVRAALVAEEFGLTMPTFTKPLPKPSKKYAASVYRRAAKLLEANPDKHVLSYGNPWESGDEQSFCAIGAIDIVLASDGHSGTDPFEPRPVYGRTWSSDPDADGVDVMGVCVTRNHEISMETGCSTLWTFNDSQPKSGQLRGSKPVMSADGNKAVVRAMRGIAARFEHAGSKRSVKSGSNA